MLIKDLFRHYFLANTLHGTHSPFVYNLYKAVFAKDEVSSLFQKIEEERDRLKRDNSCIDFLDFGANGSEDGVLKSQKVKSIAKNSLKSPKWGRAFYRLATYLEVSEILELGTSLGISTSYLASPTKISSVTTFDGSENVMEEAKNVWQNLKLTNIETVVGNIDKTLPLFLRNIQKLELVLIDANHQEEATKNYFDMLLPMCNDKTVLIFDDIYWSQGMKNAWEYIKGHPETYQTIDFYEVGLVFFRDKQEREHFRLRY